MIQYRSMKKIISFFFIFSALTFLIPAQSFAYVTTNTWTIRTSAADNQWFSIAWSPQLGLFATISNNGTGNRVMTSPDGINWTIRTTPDNNWEAIAWSPEL